MLHLGVGNEACGRRGHVSSENHKARAPSKVPRVISFTRAESTTVALPDVL